MMKNIYIVGGNGFARECFGYVQEICATDENVRFAGFLGHGGYGHTVNYMDLQCYYRGEAAEHKFAVDEYAVIGAGEPLLRRRIYDDLKAAGVRFYTLLSPSSRIAARAELGEGNVFVSTEIVSHNIKIGNGNLFNGRVIVGHDVSIGDFNFFGPDSKILGNVRIGNLNSVAVGSILLPRAKIGSGNKIAPLGVVYKGCRDNSYMAGNPALKIGEVQ